MFAQRPVPSRRPSRDRTRRRRPARIPSSRTPGRPEPAVWRHTPEAPVRPFRIGDAPRIRRGNKYRSRRKVCREKKPKGLQDRFQTVVSDVFENFIDFAEAPCSGERQNAFDSIKEKEAHFKALIGIRGNEEVLQEYLAHQMHLDIIMLLATEKDKDLRLNWLRDNFSKGHYIFMINYADELYEKALVDCPDGNFPKETHIELVSSYAKAFCQLRMDIHCLKPDYQERFVLSIQSMRGFKIFESLLEKNLHNSGILDSIFSYFDHIEYSKLPSPNYIFESIKELFTGEVALPKDVWGSKREEIVRTFRLVFSEYGPVGAINQLFKI